MSSVGASCLLWKIKLLNHGELGERFLSLTAKSWPLITI